jgi:hypothetical protein
LPHRHAGGDQLLPQWRDLAHGLAAHGGLGIIYSYIERAPVVAGALSFVCAVDLYGVALLTSGLQKVIHVEWQ